MGVKCAIWRNGHLGNCNLAPYGTTVVKELNIDVSIPAAAMVSFSHLATVEEDTGLCGLIKEMDSCNESPLNGLVLLN